jgi:YHS domain-containing protein
MATDPTSKLPMVCGRVTQGDPHYFSSAEYRGKVIYFCTESCQNAFEADPDRFYERHSRKSGPVQDSTECEFIEKG